MMEPVAVIKQRIIYRHDRPTRITKHFVHTLSHQGEDKGFRTGDLRPRLRDLFYELFFFLFHKIFRFDGV